MTHRRFKSIVEGAFQAAGFRKTAKILRFDGDAATLLVGLQKFDHNDQFFINVGFWLRELDKNVPAKIELTHMYYRLQRLFPRRREDVLYGGDLSAPDQPDKSEALGSLITEKFAPELIRMSSSVEYLRNQYKRGSLSGGLIRAEARILLQEQ